MLRHKLLVHKVENEFRCPHGCGFSTHQARALNLHLMAKCTNTVLVDVSHMLTDPKSSDSGSGSQVMAPVVEPLGRGTASDVPHGLHSPGASLMKSSPLRKDPLVSLVAASPVRMDPVLSMVAASSVRMDPVVSMVTASPVRVDPVMSLVTASPVRVNPVVSMVTTTPVRVDPVVHIQSESPSSCSVPNKPVDHPVRDGN